MIKLKLGAFMALLICVMVFAHSAAAEPPTKVTTTFSGTSTIPAGVMCDFPIDVAITFTRTVTTHFNEDGSVRSRHAVGPEQDTFSANGKTLVGEPYQVNIHRDFENGVQVAATETGVFEKVKLPGGGIFIVAGKLDDLSSGPVFGVTVDHGNPGNNIDTFCAALS